MNDNNKVTNLICPLTKRFESIYVCALNCKHKCQLYIDSLHISVLEEYILQYPEYEIKGELMAVKKQTTSADTKKQKAFWILDNEGKVVEVIEQDIIDSPQDFLDKEIWDKPPNQYELVITLKRKR
ncbi:MAG: hypothetical protein LHW55_03395 [Candidatus Cloacimonetes bacterium]|nr:hypothetical protein [Candidatus Cloacimonadota bacterium]